MGLNPPAGSDPPSPTGSPFLPHLQAPLRPLDLGPEARMLRNQIQCLGQGLELGGLCRGSSAVKAQLRGQGFKHLIRYWGS